MQKSPEVLKRVTTPLLDYTTADLVYLSHCCGSHSDVTSPLSRCRAPKHHVRR